MAQTHGKDLKLSQVVVKVLVTSDSTVSSWLYNYMDLNDYD